jgi:hypothetical protein
MKPIITLVCALAIVATGAYAQPRFEGGGGPDARPFLDNEARELLEQVMLARLSRELDLDSEQTVLMVRKYAAFREQVAALREKRTALAGDLREAVKAEAGDARVARLLDNLRAADEEIARARLTIYDEISADLTTQHKAKLYLFIAEFENQLRKWVMRMHRGRMGMPPEEDRHEPGRVGPPPHAPGEPGPGRLGPPQPPPAGQGPGRAGPPPPSAPGERRRPGMRRQPGNESPPPAPLQAN